LLPTNLTVAYAYDQWLPTNLTVGRRSTLKSMISGGKLLMLEHRWLLMMVKALFLL
jgi:hypothetical protein